MKRWFKSDQPLVGEGLRFINPKFVQGWWGLSVERVFNLFNACPAAFRSTSTGSSVWNAIGQNMNNRQRRLVGSALLNQTWCGGCLRPRQGYDKPRGLSPRDPSNAIDGLGKARTIKPNRFQAAGAGGFG